MEKFDFSGWATKNNLRCSDGRTIMRDAFKDNDGQTVPLVWNHQHNEATNVLGHALLENREEGVYAYCTFNETPYAQHAKELVKHGDICALSIHANRLKQNGGDVLHGMITEVSLVMAGANPGAFIDNVMAHGDESEDEAIIYTGEELELSHASGETTNEDEKEPEKKPEESEQKEGKEKTVKEILDSYTEEQKDLLIYMLGKAISEKDDEDENNEKTEGGNEMKHNVFDNEERNEGGILSHSDEEAIIALAKTPGVGSLQQALVAYAEKNDLQHGIVDGEVLGRLLPDYELIEPKAPKILYPDDTWVASVINGVHKSPIARVRTRRADARQAELQALGYKKGTQKKEMGKIQLLGRSHDPQTVYVKDKLNRDDILDITDFDLVAYEWDIMRHTLDQTLATAILIGDGREDIDPDKIKEDHIRPIWKDDELYCIHQDVDFTKAAVELQVNNQGTTFGENYITTEEIIAKSLYAREKYKGSGNLTFYCTPHLLNVMLLARDLNGHRMYSSKNDLAAALNVRDIKTVEQFEGLTRETTDHKTKKLLGLFVNMADYQLGCVKGGQITKFEDFDIDFNQQKLLLETRCSGALVEWYSAIALEEDVTTPG